MMFLSSVAVAALALVSQVAAHGYVPRVKIGSQIIPGWDVNTDGYTTPQPSRIVRATKPDSGFIADVNSGDITCSIGNSKLPPTEITATVAAGQTVTALWNTWPVGHYGPVLNYLARCPDSGCSKWKGDTGSPWFKIQQSVYENGEWASDTLARRSDFSYAVRIPANLKAGKYLLRHENLALHGATNIGGAQFYPVCIQLNVTGGGSFQPTGNLNFPGAYKATDPGIHFNPYQGEAANRAYVPPGGPIFPGLQ